MISTFNIQQIHLCIPYAATFPRSIPVFIKVILNALEDFCRTNSTMSIPSFVFHASSMKEANIACSKLALWEQHYNMVRILTIALMGRFFELFLLIHIFVLDTRTKSKSFINKWRTYDALLSFFILSFKKNPFPFLLQLRHTLSLRLLSYPIMYSPGSMKRGIFSHWIDIVMVITSLTVSLSLWSGIIDSDWFFRRLSNISLRSSAYRHDLKMILIFRSVIAFSIPFCPICHDSTTRDSLYMVLIASNR